VRHAHRRGYPLPLECRSHRDATTRPRRCNRR
jgi:hypothetical protein